MAADNIIQYIIEVKERGARSAVSSVSSEINKLEGSAGDAGAAVEKLGEKGAAAARGIGSGMRDAGAAVTGFGDHVGQEMRHVVAMFDEAARHSRGQFIGSFAALMRDSGLAGKAIAAIGTTTGMMATGAVAAIGTIALALADLASQAAATEAAMSRIYGAGALRGAPLNTEAQARAAVRSMTRSGVMPQSSALAAAQQIFTMPMLTGTARQQIIKLVPAFYLANPELQSDKAMAKYLAQFGSLAGLRNLVIQGAGATNAQMPAVAAALRGQNLGALQSIVLGTLTARLGPGLAAIRRATATAQANPIAGPAIGGLAAPVTPEMMLPGALAGKIRLPYLPAGYSPAQAAQALKAAEEALPPLRHAGAGAGVRNPIPGNAKPIAAGLMAAHLGLSGADIGIILGGLYGESGLNPLALNPKSGALGIEQALGPRKRALIASGGANTLSGQIAFLISELRGDHRGALAAIRGAGSPAAKMSAFLSGFEGITPQNLAAATGGKLTGEAGFAQLISQRLGYAGRFSGAAGKVSTAAEKSTLKSAGEMITQLAKEDEAAARDAAAEEKRRAQAMKDALKPVEAIIRKWPEVFKEGLAATERANAKAIAQMDRAWDKFSSPIEHKISDALTDAVLGIRQRGGMREVMLGIEKSVVGGMMSNVVKNLGNSLVKPLFTSLLGSGGIGGGIANLLFNSGTETTKISLLTLIAANTGATAAAAGVSAAATGTSAVGTGFSAIGAFSGIKSAVGWLGGLFGFAQGGIVPSAAGGWSLPSFAGAQPALLHSREMVLPADISEGLQGMIRGASGGDVHVHNHFHGPADGASVGRWFGANRTALTETIRDAWNSGALAFP